jgi:hypothetical protein
MAVYKVIQDVEAEDKILGPLSLKQLIFAAIAGGTIFIAFRLVVATGAIYVAIPFLPIVLVFGILAAPLGRDQPTEMWLAAQIRFFTKPRKRLWDQSGLKELVNITVPKKEEKQYTDGLNQQQVQSRLKALATTLDSRGWAVKNVDVNMYAPNAYGSTLSDRLVDPRSLPTAVSDINITASDDILDVANNQVAQHFDEMMQASGKAHKDAVIARMHTPVASKSAQAEAPQDYWFMYQNQAPKAGSGAAMFGEAVVQPMVNTQEDGFVAKSSNDQSVADAKKILEQANQQKATAVSQYSAHHKIIPTLEQQAKAQQEAAKNPPKAKPEQMQTHLSKADTIELANANLKVSTIAGLAKHKVQDKQDPTEVIVKLR